MLELQVHITTPTLHVGTKEPNSGQRSHTASALPTEASPQTRINLFLLAEPFRLDLNKIWSHPHNLDLGREKSQLTRGI